MNNEFYAFCRANGLTGCIDDSRVIYIGEVAGSPIIQVVATVWVNGVPWGISSAFPTGNTPAELDAARLSAKYQALENAGFSSYSAWEKPSLIAQQMAEQPTATIPETPAVTIPVAPAAPATPTAPVCTAVENDMPHTFEEAMAVVIPQGSHAGKTMAELAGQQQKTVRWFAEKCNSSAYARVITAAKIIVAQWDNQN